MLQEAVPRVERQVVIGVVEFRQNGKIVGAGSTDIGGAIGASVPTGEIDVYVNGELYGQASSEGPSTLDEEGNLEGGTYLSGPGCPQESPFD